MIIELFILESTVLRTEKLVSKTNISDCKNHIVLMMLKLHESIDRAKKHGKEAIYAIANGDEQRIMLMGLKRFTKVNPYNLKKARRRIADAMIKKGSFCFFKI